MEMLRCLQTGNDSSEVRDMEDDIGDENKSNGADGTQRQRQQ